MDSLDSASNVEKWKQGTNIKFLNTSCITEDVIETAWGTENERIGDLPIQVANEQQVNLMSATVGHEILRVQM